MATEPVLIEITSGNNPGPFILYGSGSSGLYALHDINYPIDKTSLSLGLVFDVPDGYSSSIIIQSVEGFFYPFCTTSTSTNISSTTTTTTTTTLPPDCGTFTFNIPNNGWYYLLDNFNGSYCTFNWELPIDMDNINSITSWELQITSSQYNGDKFGNPYTETINNGTNGDKLKNRVTVSSSLSGSSGNITLYSQSLNNLSGNLFSGSFTFNNPGLPRISYLPTTNGYFNDKSLYNFEFDYLWQDNTTVKLKVVYEDKCSVTNTINSTSNINGNLVINRRRFLDLSSEPVPPPTTGNPPRGVEIALDPEEFDFND